MNTYYWKINAVDCYALKDGLEKVAYNIHWSYFATDGAHVAVIGGVAGVDDPSPENFIPFDQLTEQQVIDWFIAELDIENMKGELTKLRNIQNQYYHSHSKALNHKLRIYIYH